jgi:hypothetical protein
MTEGSVAVSRRSQLKEKAVNEYKRFAIIVVYLWCVFGLLSVHKSFVLAQQHLNYQEETLAIVNALVFAKVLLVGEHLHMGTRFKDKPLIYSILYKSFVFALLILGFHLVENLAMGYWHGKTVVESLPILSSGDPREILDVSVVAYVVLLPFFAFREIARVFGRKELWSLVFRERVGDPVMAWPGGRTQNGT